MFLSFKNPHNTAVDVALRAGPSATGVASAHHLSVRRHNSEAFIAVAVVPLHAANFVFIIARQTKRI